MIAIVFDLDGTLIESAPDIHDAVNRTLAQEDYPELSLEKVTSFVGNGVPKLIERVMKEVGIDEKQIAHEQLVSQFSVFYAMRPAEKSYTFEYVKEVLNRLDTSGHKLAVCTNKPYDLTLKVLDGLDIRHFFKAVVGGDSLTVKKPDPEPLFKTLEILGAKNCIYVGDSEVDASTAQHADQPFFLFTEGYRKTPANQLNAVARFDHFGELFGLIKQYELQTQDTT